MMRVKAGNLTRSSPPLAYSDQICHCHFRRVTCAIRSLHPDGGSMKIPRLRGTGRRPSRWATMICVAALVVPVAACSSGPEGTVVNLYGGASGSGFDKIIADCNQQ